MGPGTKRYYQDSLISATTVSNTYQSMAPSSSTATSPNKIGDASQEQMISCGAPRPKGPQTQEWEVFVKLMELDEAAVDRLKASGVSTVADVEAWGAAADEGTGPNNDADDPHAPKAAGLTLVQMQKFRVISSYLANGERLTSSCSLDEMGRTNARLFRGESLDVSLPMRRPLGRPRKDDGPKEVKRSGWIGRPRKDGKRPGSVPKVTRAIGRPRKDSLSPGSSSITSLNSGMAATTRKRTVPPADMPDGFKRPRGRPRKDGLPPGTAPTIIKKKGWIGRPRKDGKRPGSVPGQKDAQVAKKSTATTTPKEAGKKGRVGRPRKDGLAPGSMAMAKPPRDPAKPVQRRGHAYEITYQGPPTTEPSRIEGGAWPQGWKQVNKAKHNDGSIKYSQWVSPGGKIFRSIPEVNLFLQALSTTVGNNDEDAAWKAHFDRNHENKKKKKQETAALSSSSSAAMLTEDGTSTAFAQHGQDLTDKEVQELLDI